MRWCSHARESRRRSFRAAYQGAPTNNCTITPFSSQRGLWSLEICPNAKMRDCANVEMSQNLNENGGYKRDQGSLEEQQCTTQSWLLQIDLNRFFCFCTHLNEASVNLVCFCLLLDPHTLFPLNPSFFHFSLWSCFWQGGLVIKQKSVFVVVWI